MNNTREYGGLDYFRIIAAVFIVAIHTSPLSMFSETADFIFTRVLCRVAVPFFLMVSGYFLYGDHSKMKDKVNRFAKKTALLYGIAILLYLPINIYNGYFKAKPLLINLLRDILFDGTLYHLWYLPAAILGACLTLLLFRIGKDSHALSISAALYLIGLFGDSYYGIAVKLGPMRELYNILFQFSDYTRNGIFYAPIFLVLGGLASRHRKHFSLFNSIHGLVVSTSLMLMEGLVLYYFNLQRHDSMYLMLLPCMYNLFQIILHWKGDAKPKLRKVAMVIYIIHPMAIILLRGIAKYLKLQSLLIENSLIHYLAVLTISGAIAIIYGYLSVSLHRKRPNFDNATGPDSALYSGNTSCSYNTPGSDNSLSSYSTPGFDHTSSSYSNPGSDHSSSSYSTHGSDHTSSFYSTQGSDIASSSYHIPGSDHALSSYNTQDSDNASNSYHTPGSGSTLGRSMGRAWLEIDLGALEHNVKFLSHVIPKGCEIMAIVKANAYGHGDYEIASHLNRIGIHAFGVATIDEGITLRKHGIHGDILVMGYTDPARSSELHHYHLMQTVIDYDYARKLNRSKKPIQVHLKIDTGMHRIGLHANEVDRIEELFSLPMLTIQGIFTHLCVADSLSREDILYTKKQINAFYELICFLKERGISIPKIHFQSSYGLLNYPYLYGDYVRIGIALYGTLSSLGDKTRVEADLQPVLSLKARIAMVQTIAKGEQVGYGRNFSAKRDSLLAVLPIGYADGLPRNLSCETGRVLVHGHYAPIVGRICMDQLLADITDIPDVKPGDIATIIGKDGCNEITAAEVAYESCSITNELLSRLGTRLERIYGFEFQ